MEVLISLRFLAVLRIVVIFVSNVQCLNLIKVASSLPAPKAQSNQDQNQDSGSGSDITSLLSKPKSDIIISMADSYEPFIQSFVQRAFNTRSERNAALANGLQSISSQSQGPVIQALKTFQVNSQSYWITNQIFVKEASPTLIQSIASMPMVKSVIEDLKIPLPPIFNVSVGKVPTGPEWNIRKIGAHKVWNDTTGEGIVVGGIDTGVRGTHTAIKKNYVGRENFGWHDPFLSTAEPEDGHGHGTHTIATAVGGLGVGVAPGAKWMACRGCFLDSCLQHALIACGQFMLCPGGDKKTKKGKIRCATAPHVINNSWGGPGGPRWFEPVINAWRAAGIIPIFAIGNSGPKCETLGSPGEGASVLAVGSTDKHDKLSKFSSRGPKMVGGGSSGPMGLLGILNSASKEKTALTNITKPDLCAPGQDINSAHMVTDNAYKVLSGTSMASPAVAGAAALLLSANPTLSYDEMMELFTSTTKQNLKPVNEGQCGSTPDNEFPNHMYGWGRINVHKAFLKMLGRMKDRDEPEQEESQ